MASATADRPQKGAAANGTGRGVPLGDREFQAIREFIYRRAGIHLSTAKRALVAGRLEKRLRELGCAGYREYLALLDGDPRPGSEAQRAIDLLTTNETYFFREQKHFDYLVEHVLPTLTRAPQGLRIWSAACSSGEEPYSIAMTLAEHAGARPWSVLATDLSQRVLERARAGIYPLDRAERIPRSYLRAYCLRGTGSKEGLFAVARKLRERVEFRTLNLNAELPEGLGLFDVIFLRNVMIYFDLPTKQALIARLIARLRPGGYLFVGHSESLNGVTSELIVEAPSIYRRP
ncbi:CheR family methyltransferase [Acidihalobacter prosperus]|uniref:Chemotaxis protein methyltransferase n=1 Tax=Acidihalobacter prosperus TaxID=160660 RepID=A0A1A6C5N2_9GAMM|nr:protein-glutamate O-methyltransferase CheR [Acidihalobacter prosperus]OBS09872.1 Chemotaxis protein methyltransferase CheR [Acidihalobacter prosperus]